MFFLCCLAVMSATSVPIAIALRCISEITRLVADLTDGAAPGGVPALALLRRLGPDQRQ